MALLQVQGQLDHVRGANMKGSLGKVFSPVLAWLAERFLVYRPAAFEKVVRLSACALIMAFLFYLLANLEPADWRGRTDTFFLITANLVIGLALILILLRGLISKQQP